MPGRTLILFCLILSGRLSAQMENIETVVQTGHSSVVTCTDFNTDKRLLISGSLDHSLILWDYPAQKQIRTFNWHSSGLKSAVFNSKGDHLLSCSSEGVYITNIETGQLVHQFKPDKHEYTKAVFSPDEKKVLISNAQSQVEIYDLGSERLLITVKKDYDAGISPYMIDPTGTKVLSFKDYKTVEIKSLDSNTVLRTLDADKCHDMMFTPNGKHILLSSRKVHSGIYDAETGQILRHLKVDENAVCDGCNTRAIFSNDGKLAFTAAHKSGGALWDVKKGKKLWHYPIESNRVKSIGFSGNNQFVWIVTYQEFILLSGASGKVIRREKLKSTVPYQHGSHVASNYVAIPGNHHIINIVNVTNGQVQYQLKGINNVSSQQDLPNRLRDTRRFYKPKTKAAISPDGKWMVVTQTDSSVIIRSIQTGKQIRRLSGHTGLVIEAEFSPDGKLLATAGYDRSIRVWNTSDWTLNTSIITPADIIFDLDFNSDNTEILSASWDGLMTRWRLKDGRRLNSVNVGPSSGYIAGYSPNDLYLAGANVSGDLDLYEADAGESFRSIIGHTDLIVDLVFSPDQTSFATASKDGKVKIWDLYSGMLKAKINAKQGGFNTVAYSPDGDMMVVGGDQRVIGLYDSKGKHIGDLKGHSGSVSSLEFSGDGKLLLSCTVDREIKVWDMTSRKELYTYIQIDRNEWLSRHSSGHFDGAGQALKSVNYVSGTKAIGLNSLFKKFYTPGLIEELMSGQSFQTTGDNLEKMIRQKPKPALLIEGKVIEPDSVLIARDSAVKLQLSLPNGSENDQVRIYNNGKLVAEDDMSSTIKFRGGEGVAKDFNVSLNNGLNDISFVVVNDKGLESEPQKVRFNMDGEAGKTDLFILTIGINDYKNPNYRLNYAVSDVNAFAKTVTEETERLFNKVYTYSIKNSKAVKENIEAKIQEIASQVGPEDVFILYYAGHGVLNSDQNFYLVTYDITNFFGNDDALAEKAISADELSQMAIMISAQKQVYILDACHSGGALKQLAQRGGGREKALAQLARSTGTFYLTASQDYQFANEASDLKHGLFTYAILEALNGEVTSISLDKKLTIGELRTYVEERVPELSETYHGQAQFPTSYSFGQDFPIKILE